MNKLHTHMGRELTFKINRKEYTVEPRKIDRKKLYGSTEILALDENGNPCKLVSTDPTGQFMMDKGGTGLGILTPAGEWADRSQLKIVQTDGSPVSLHPSSYKVVNLLKKKVSMETFLNYTLTDFYELSTPHGELARAIGEDIYTFTYSYLDNYEGSTAFVLVSAGIPFLLIGQENQFEWLCFADCGEATEEEEDLLYLEEEEEDLDFSMF